MTAKGRGAGTVGFPDLRAGEVGLIFATVIARKNQGQNSDIDFRTQEIAYAQAQGQLDDAMIRRLIERDGVIGAVMDAWVLEPNWMRGVTTNARVTLANVVNHIAGNARHAAIGTDLDGGYGTEQTPHAGDTIADAQKLAGLLRDRGYGEEDVRMIMHGNWLRLLEGALPS